jgi:DNA/RNA-binding domain of Phe-tRNA-synthetase-like protein
MRADISGIIDDFPDTQVAFLVAEGLKVEESRPLVLSEMIARTEAGCRTAFNRDEVGKIPGIAVWRTAYKGFGVRKTSYRSSVERLLRNVLNDKPLAAINSLVDCYNRISVQHVMPIGADDLDRIDGGVCFRLSREGDDFFALGQDGNDPPKTGEVVYADDAKLLCRRWNWYQDARSPVSLQTRRAVLTIQSQGPGELQAAAAELAADIARFCGGEVRWRITNANTPVLDV